MSKVVCMCVYIYTRTHTRAHAHAHAHTSTHTHARTHTNTHTLLMLLVEHRLFKFELIFNLSEPEGNYMQNTVQNLKTPYFENRVSAYIVLF